MQERSSNVPVLRILRLKDVLRMTSISRSSHFERLNKASKHYDPTYPKPVQLGARAVGYVEQEVVDWIENKMDERREV